MAGTAFLLRETFPPFLHPTSAAPPCHTGGALRDGALRWFEAYAGALASGAFAVDALDSEYPASIGICLFPQLPPGRSEAITQVRA